MPLKDPFADGSANSFLQAPKLTEVQERRASLNLAGLCVKSGGSAGELLETLAMLGLVDTKQALRGVERFAGVVGHERPVDVSTAVTAPATTELCPSGEHIWAEEVRYVCPNTGRRRCRLCENRRNKARRATGLGAKPKDPDAPILCRCPGRKHSLTAVTSESTYVSPSGQRQCKVGIARRNAAYQDHDDHQEPA